MSNAGFLKYLSKEGFNLEITSVGDRYVLDKMLERCDAGRRAVRTYYFRNHATTGDGILSGLQLLQALIPFRKVGKRGKRRNRNIPTGS